jgi:hypothetical protein
MKTFTDPTSRIQYTFEEKEVISVYLRRSNGKKRLLFSSLNATKAFDMFHHTAVFKGDMKYLETNDKEMSRRLLFQKGIDIPPVKLNRAGRKREASYKINALPGISNVPNTLITDLDAVLETQFIPDTSKHLSRNKLMQMLLAYYVSLKEDDRKQLNKDSHWAYSLQRVKSGGDFSQTSAKAIVKNNFLDNVIDDGDLL